ncbi:Cell death abnormality protein 2 [Caenorhabditis elegans]|uniref:Cell death abnormality protein 2 n=5 Tax=Caenorhabditis elegans TaxID=6239 RepID=CED2_CAEEL|nr:Cell death abnormality protein 2 [Caenorhabditis elegans]Q9NHC3.1 RecName: Full=Cell death abnormality protein 2; AltName: Full=Cell-corpse engulfment protein CED-2 [Caenorhabditis elegans]AAF33845.1 cell-corpse engulfment protein CED-2 [Caenorhabditis elegans]CCD66714.1 Cell death abnormality protein 2 [Caenorhabditis elegans]|eukprot:NP_500105.1 Cell death abnormality protein 2 [Caenorhabditis elegans]
MTTNGFDPFEWRSFYFPGMSREEAHKLLGEPQVSIGTFLMRDSSRPGEYSLTVREADEGNAVCHYLIERGEPKEDGTAAAGVKIANQSFPDIPALLNHFKMRVLTEASLLAAYKKPIIEVVVGTFKFTGERETDLPFEQGERLEILSKTNQDWWEARNALGTTGLVPANYVQIQMEFHNDRTSKGASQSSIGSSGGGAERFSSASTSSDNIELQPRLPAKAKVTFDRVPNAYDPTQLRVKKGQTVLVTQKMSNGMYKAELDGQIGSVPHTYLRFTAVSE